MLACWEWKGLWGLSPSPVLARLRMLLLLLEEAAAEALVSALRPLVQSSKQLRTSSPATVRAAMSPLLVSGAAASGAPMKALHR